MNLDTEMSVVSERWNQWSILSLRGKFMLKHFGTIRPVFESLWSTPGAKVAIDLSETRLMDSSAITLLVNFHKRLKEAGGLLTLMEPHEDIRLLFSVVEFERNIPVFETRAAFESAAASGTV